MTSLAKILANRMNAKKSTGPKSARGKKIVAQNAIKHGIFASDMSVVGLIDIDEMTDFEQLVSDLRRGLRPEGRMEDLLVEKIAVNYWRLRRLVNYEITDVRLQFMQVFDQICDEYQKDLASTDAPGRDSLIKYLCERKHDLSPGRVARRAARLARISQSDYAFDDDYALKWLFRRVLQPTMSSRVLPPDWREKAHAYLAGLDPAQKAELRRVFIEEETRNFQELNTLSKFYMTLAANAPHHGLPADETLPKVLRYETALERSISRNLVLLLKLQHARKAQTRSTAAPSPNRASNISLPHPDCKTKPTS